MTGLEDCRAKIRETDKRILAVIKERLDAGAQVAEIKRDRSLPTIDSDAEQATMSNLIQLAGDLGVEKKFAERLGELLIEETVRVEETTQPAPSKDLLMKEMFELTQKLTSEGRKVTRFEIGEPNFPAPKEVLQGLDSTFRKKKVVGYGPSAGLPELRKAIASELSKQHGTSISSDQILITPGARFAIFATVTSFVSSLERVVIPQPAWPAYEECVNFVKGRVIPLKTSFEAHWDIDLDTLELELKKGVRLLVLNSPCNPTGRVISKEKFKRTVDLAAKYNTTILSDEVYDRYVHCPAPSILESDYDNFVYVNSFSKQFSLTGWRIGYLATTKENATKIRRILQTAVTCVPEFIQNAALVALKRARGEAQRNIKAIMEKVELTCRELSKIDVSFHKPEGAFYVFPKANKPNFDSLAFAKHLLEKTGVSITPGQAFGEYPEFFRLAVSLPRARIPAAVKSIGAAIESWS
ncbi:MAG TPA: aminotransferase class I/II-fold pyridoxal phosphate-dependent enzyme [Candidatus Dormibacteraeota bacterium]|nr:aminotransferase class I/II-fold pyridoxal phosphate-dependent enzyme [Candidatus Dormibacteraeota bacterium]